MATFFLNFFELQKSSFSWPGPYHPPSPLDGRDGWMATKKRTFLRLPLGNTRLRQIFILPTAAKPKICSLRLSFYERAAVIV